MVDWRALGAGGVTVAVMLYATLSTASDLFLLVFGIPCGAVTGYVAGGILRGGVYGLVVASVVGVLIVAVFWSAALEGRAAPGLGFGLFLTLLLGIAISVQGLVAGAFGGLVARGVAAVR